MLGLSAGSGFFTYSRLANEEPVAWLIFDKLSPQYFQLTLKSASNCESKQYAVYGDQWRVDARFLKWKSWANLLGFDALVRLERVSGRYTSLEEQNTKKHLSIALVDKPWLDLLTYASEHAGFISPLDTIFGSSVYQTIDTSLLYSISRTQSGLIVRQSQRENARFVDGTLVINIRSSC